MALFLCIFECILTRQILSISKPALHQPGNFLSPTYIFLRKVYPVQAVRFYGRQILDHVCLLNAYVLSVF